ncbi:MAG: outer membrane lipoprotein-sorting protein [bacterium]
MSKLNVDNKLIDDLPANDPLVQTQKYFQEIFGKKCLLIIGIENIPTIYNISTLKKVKDISEEIKQLYGIIGDEVISLSTANNIKGREGGVEVGAFMKDIPHKEEKLNQLKKYVRENDMFYGRLVSRDETMTMIIVSIEDLSGAEKNKVVEQIYTLTKRFEMPERFYFGGDPIGEYEMDVGIQGDIKRLIPFAFLLILVGFYIFFRRLRGVIIPTMVIILSIIWTMGLIGLLGYKINVVTSLIPVTLLAITSSYGVHLIHRYFEVTPHIRNGHQASCTALQRVTKPILMAGITSALGTVTLVIFKVVSIKEFGIFLSLGIVFGFLLILTFAPAVLTLLRPQTGNIDTSISGIFDNLMRKFASFIMRNQVICLVIIGIIFLVSLIGISLIKVGINYSKLFPKDHKITISANKFNEKIGGSIPLSIMIETPESDGIKKPEILRKMLELENYAQTIEGVGNTDSFARLIKRMNYVMNGEKKEFDVIPNSPELIAQYLLLYSMSGNPGDFDNFVDYEYRRAKVTLSLTTFDQEHEKVILEKIQNYVNTHFPKDVKIAYEGSTIYWIAETNYVVKGKIQNIISSIFIVFLFCVMCYRSFKLGLLSIVPLTIATLLTFGMMGFLGIRLNLATALITSIAVGIGVDFAIHYLTIFREEVNKGLNYPEATVATMISSGKPIVFDMVSNVLGFIVFISSDFLPIQNLGWLIILTMVTVAIGTLIILPVFLSFVDIKSLTYNFTLEKERTMSYHKKNIIHWIVISIGLIFWFLFSFRLAFSEELIPNREMTARQIMQKNDEIQTSKDSFSVITMKLINEKEKERIRKIFYCEKKDKDDNRNTLVTFQFPADVKGTKLLTLEHKSKEDDQWLYLPALRKTRRISASDKRDSFMGSDFTYEDMEQDDLNEFEYNLLGVTDINKEPSYYIECIPVGKLKKNETTYSRREFWIRKSDFVILKINYYDKKGNLLKTLIASDIKLINQKPRAHKIIMENFQRKHKTELIYEEIKLDTGLPDNLFTERELMRE